MDYGKQVVKHRNVLCFRRFCPFAPIKWCSGNLLGEPPFLAFPSLPSLPLLV